MAENSFIDIFDLCWNAIFVESKAHGHAFFSEKHCTMEESRDINFDIVENRLAYLYKFGCFNAVFIQKCIACFLDKCSEGEKLFLRENLKVCSISNGPGLDLVGLLCEVYKSNQNLKSLPVLKTINLYRSWLNTCFKIFIDVFQAASASSNGSFDYPSEIIHFIQCDIYSTLSHDVEECIKDSDILLMMKAFASTKATSDVVMKSLKKIFTLLKPGSYVFYIGSKNNTKKLTANNFMNKLVNCILGPIKISVDDLPVNEAVVKSINVKPKESGYAYFIVWQKKDSVSLNDVPKKKRNRKKSAAQVQSELTNSDIFSNKITNDTDESSDTLFSSPSEQSKTLSEELRSTPSEEMFQSISPVDINLQNLGKEEHNVSPKSSTLSLNNITSLFDKIHINSERENLTEIKDIPETGKVNICIIEKNSHERGSESYVAEDEIVTHIKNENDLSNKMYVGKSTADVEMVLNKDFFKPESQLVEESTFYEKKNMKSGLTDQLNKELHLIQKYVPLTKENSIHLPDKSNGPVTSSDKKESAKAVQFNYILSSNEKLPNSMKNIQAKKNKTHVATQKDVFCSLDYAQQVEKSKTVANSVTNYLGFKEGINEASSSKLSFRNSTINLHGTKMLGTVSEPRIIPDSQLHDNILGFKIIKLKEDGFKIIKLKEETPEINDRDKNLNSLLQSCENLVTSLEQLTANFKKSIYLSNDQDTRCCSRKSCTKFKIKHASGYSCCNNAVQLHCCRKVCNCHMFDLNGYATCPKQFHEEKEFK